MTDKQFKSVSEALEDANKRMKSEGVQKEFTYDAYYIDIFRKDSKELLDGLRGADVDLKGANDQTRSMIEDMLQQIEYKISKGYEKEEDFLHVVNVINADPGVSREQFYFDDIFSRVTRYI